VSWRLVAAGGGAAGLPKALKDLVPEGEDADKSIETRTKKHCRVL
jgi:hypothetical protein